MEAKGQVIDIHKDYRTKKFQMVLEVETYNPEEDLRGDVRVIVKKWRNKRSLDANGYMWALIQQIAIQLDSTKDEIYEDLIQRYGILDTDQGYITVTLRRDIDVSKHLPGHWKLYTTTPLWRCYRRIKGTSEYDTKEMSYFLDRVIEEAKSLGIETATLDEIERIKSYGK